MPSCFLPSVGAHQAEDPVGLVGVGGPDLLAVQDEVVAVAHGAGLERREVRAGARLGVALAPADLAAARSSGRCSRFCSSLPKRSRVGPIMVRPKPISGGGRRQPRHLLAEHLGLLGGEAAAAVLLRPGRRRPAALRARARARPAGRRSRTSTCDRPRRRGAGRCRGRASEAGALASSQARVSRRKVSRSAIGGPPKRRRISLPSPHAHPARQPARLLRRRRPRHRDRRARPRALRAAGLRAPRDRAQPPRGRRPAREGRRVRRGSARGAARLAARVQRPRRLARGAARPPRSRACARSTPPARSSPRCTSRRSASRGAATRSCWSATRATSRSRAPWATRPGSIRLVETVEDVGAPRRRRIPSASRSSRRRRSRWTTRAR